MAISEILRLLLPLRTVGKYAVRERKRERGREKKMANVDVFLVCFKKIREMPEFMIKRMVMTGAAMWKCLEALVRELRQENFAPFKVFITCFPHRLSCLLPLPLALLFLVVLVAPCPAKYCNAGLVKGTR